jgi:hypothetical protein
MIKNDICIYVHPLFFDVLVELHMAFVLFGWFYGRGKRFVCFVDNSRE